VGEVVAGLERSVEIDGFTCETCLLRNPARGEEIPALWLKPKQPAHATVVWADVRGKAGLFAPNAEGRTEPRTEVQQLLSAGVSVLGADLLFQGESLADGKPVTQTRRVKNPREAAAYTFGYNHALFAQRVHDLLTLIAHLKSRRTERIGLAGFDGAGPWVAAALAQARGAVQCAAVDTAGFRFGHVLDLQHIDFLPGGARYGDLPGMLALAPPTPLWVSGESEVSLAMARRQYQAAGQPEALVRWDGAADALRAGAADWLLTQLKP